MLYSFVTTFVLFAVVNGHGRLTVPATRKPTGYENDPVPSNSHADFVCRNAVTSPATTLTAGSSLTVQWDLSALHVGDCSFYVSYDWDAASNADMKWFKIANFMDCKAVSGQPQTITIPEWIPAGRAVLRWEWYALHVFPTIEFYSQCADVNIVAGEHAIAKSAINTYSVISPATLPASGNSGIGFRNAFGNGEQYMTGPPCARAYAGNNCEKTAAGTTGHVDVGSITPSTPSPTAANATPAPTDSSTPAPTNAYATPSPTDASATPSPTAQPNSGCAVHEVKSGESLWAIGQQYGTSWELVCKMNLLENCANIFPGQKLLVAPESNVVRTSTLGQGYGDVFQIVVSYECSSRRRVDGESLVAPTRV